MIAPLPTPAVRKLEHSVAPVEANDADCVPAQVLTTRLGHRDDAAGSVHEALVHHDAGDEAVGHQVGLHLADRMEAGVALRAIGGRGGSLFRPGGQGGPLCSIPPARAAAE